MQSRVFTEISAHADRIESVKYPEPQRVFVTNYTFSMLLVIGINIRYSIKPAHHHLHCKVLTPIINYISAMFSLHVSKLFWQ